MYMSFDLRYKGQNVVLQIVGTSDNFEPKEAYFEDEEQTDLSEAEIWAVIEANMTHITSELRAEEEQEIKDYYEAY